MTIKLTPAQKDEIRARYFKGAKKSQLVKDYAVSYTHVTRIIGTLDQGQPQQRNLENLTADIEDLQAQLVTVKRTVSKLADRVTNIEENM